MATSVITLGACIETIMRNRTLNIARLTQLLGYSSATILSRIIHNKAKQNAMTKVYRDLLHCENIHLSDQERDMLEDAMIWIEQDSDRAVYRELRLLLSGKTDPPVMPTFIGASQSALLACPDTDGDEPVECLVINACFDSAIGYIQALLRAYPRISISHYMAYPSSPLRMVQIFRKLYPILCRYRYSLYTGQESCPQIPDYNVIVFRSKQREAELLFAGDLCKETLCSGVFDKWTRILQEFRFAQLTDQFPMQGSSVMLNFIDACYAREENRESIELTPDLCIRFINPEIVKAAFASKCKALGLHFAPEMEAALFEAFQKRHRNVFESKKSFRMILSKQAMLEFVNSGSLCDHVSLMRPFTVAERMQILIDLYNHITSNSFMLLNFLQEQDEYLLNSDPQSSLACFGEESMLIGSISKYYKTAPDLIAPDSINLFLLVIEDPSFIKLVRSFLWNELLPAHTSSQEEALAFIQECIKRLSDALDAAKASL